MAQTGYTPLLTYGSTTASNVPLAANLTTSASGVELAINAADGKLFYKDSGGVVQVLATKSATSGTFATLTATATTTASSNKGAINYGTLSFSDTGIVQSAQTSVNSYFQNVIQNTSNGAAASAEFIAYNDQGTATTNYATVGINSSGYSGTGSINAPGYGYFLTASTDLVLGTIGANGIHFTTNSSATDALAISSAGAVSLPGGTANGVAYLNGSNVVTTGSALTFDGTNLGIGGAANSYGGYSSLQLSNATNGGIIDFKQGSTALGQVLFNTTQAYIFAQATGIPLLFGVNNAEQMRLTSTGLGIGTSSPASKLDVLGSSTGVVKFTNSGAKSGWLYSDSAGIAISDTADLTKNGLYINNTSNYIALYTGATGAERLRIDSSGNLLVGTTSSLFTNSKIQATNSSGPTLGIQQTTSTEYVGGFWNKATGSTSLVAFYSGTSGSQVGGITFNGSLVLYNATSDQRLKTNIVDAASASDLIDAIKVRQYDWKSDGSHQRYGFIAQELVTVAPEAVHQPADPEEMMAVDYSKLVPMLVKEIQSLRKRLAALEAK